MLSKIKPLVLTSLILIPTPILFSVSCNNDSRNPNSYWLSQYRQNDDLNGMRIVFNPDIFSSEQPENFWLDFLPENTGYFLGPANIEFDTDLDSITYKEPKNLRNYEGLWMYKGLLNINKNKKLNMFDTEDCTNTILLLHSTSPEYDKHSIKINQNNFSESPIIPWGFDPKTKFTNPMMGKTKLYHVNKDFEFSDCTSEELKQIGNLFYFNRDFERDLFSNEANPESKKMFPANIDPDNLEIQFAFNLTNTTISSWLNQNPNYEGDYFFSGNRTTNRIRSNIEFDRDNDNSKYRSFYLGDNPNTLYFNFTDNVSHFLYPQSYSSNFVLTYCAPEIPEYKTVNKMKISDFVDGVEVGVDNKHVMLVPLIFDNNLTIPADALNFDPLNSAVSEPLYLYTKYRFCNNVPSYVKMDSSTGVIECDKSQLPSTFESFDAIIEVSIDQDKAPKRLLGLPPLRYTIHFYNDTDFPGIDVINYQFVYKTNVLANDFYKSFDAITFKRSDGGVVSELILPNKILEIRNNIVNEITDSFPTISINGSDDLPSSDNWGISYNNGVFSCTNTSELPADGRKDHYIELNLPENKMLKIPVYQVPNSFPTDTAAAYSIYFCDKDCKVEKIISSQTIKFVPNDKQHDFNFIYWNNFPLHKRLLSYLDKFNPDDYFFWNFLTSSIFSKIKF